MIEHHDYLLKEKKKKYNKDCTSHLFSICHMSKFERTKVHNDLFVQHETDNPLLAFFSLYLMDDVTLGDRERRVKRSLLHWTDNFLVFFSIMFNRVNWSHIDLSLSLHVYSHECKMKTIINKQMNYDQLLERNWPEHRLSSCTYGRSKWSMDIKYRCFQCQRTNEWINRFLIDFNWEEKEQKKNNNLHWWQYSPVYIKLQLHRYLIIRFWHWPCRPQRVLLKQLLISRKIHHWIRMRFIEWTYLIYKYNDYFVVRDEIFLRVIFVALLC